MKQGHGLNEGERVAFFGEHGWVVGFTATAVKVDFGDGPVEIHADKPLWVVRKPDKPDLRGIYRTLYKD